MRNSTTEKNAKFNIFCCRPFDFLIQCDEINAFCLLQWIMLINFRYTNEIKGEKQKRQQQSVLCFVALLFSALIIYDICTFFFVVIKQLNAASITRFIAFLRPDYLKLKKKVRHENWSGMKTPSATRHRRGFKSISNSIQSVNTVFIRAVSRHFGIQLLRRYSHSFSHQKTIKTWIKGNIYRNAHTLAHFYNNDQR